MECMAPLPKDPLVVVANRTMANWDKKTKEVERRRKQWI